MLIPDECRGWIKIQRPDSDYENSLKEDFRQIEPFLPGQVNSILDIGCGMAGIDVYLKGKFPKAKLLLLDGDSDSHHKYGFQRRCAPYNSRPATESLLKANGVEFERWIDSGTKEKLEADLVISLLSWGFHYPLDVYKVSGFCIADIRRSHEEPRGTIIAKAEKYDRCAFIC